MRLPIFTSFIIFVIFTQFAIRRSDNKERSLDEKFWEREHKANATRRKSLDGLDYITIPMDKLPFGKCPENQEILYCEKHLKQLSTQKIVNLTGFTNTDLKLEYGAPNITSLTTYDQNYTTLVTNLQKWGKHLYDEGLYQDAATVLEFAVSTRTDVTATYKLLCDIYNDKLHYSYTEFNDKLNWMSEIAESLNSLSKEQIRGYLDSFSPKEKVPE